MNEGWVGDDYLILFSETEIGTVSARYAFSEFLPGFQVVGLRGWDDFIVRDSAGSAFSIPTVPIDPQYLAPFTLPQRMEDLLPDARFAGRIKWYTTPIVFGGNPGPAENLTWVDLELHTRLVQWWNRKYREATNDRHGRIVTPT